MNTKLTCLISLFSLVSFIVSCGGGSSSSESLVEIEQISIVDSTSEDFSGFGTKSLRLINGNIVVHKFQNNNFANAGTISVYNPDASVLLNTIVGDAIDDKLGSDGMIALPNGNFLIISSEDDVSGLTDAGSVILVNSDGSVLATIAGDQSGDNIGSDGIRLLENGNFTVRSRMDDVGAVVDAGSVMLIGSETGNVIATLSGDTVAANFANAGVFPLSNGNFVISSTVDDIGGIDDVGSVKLINGSTGAIISSIEGDQLEDNLGSGGIAVLNNGNFVISSWRDDVTGIQDAGSVKLVNGSTGNVIASIDGDDTEDYFGQRTVLILSNQNFVIASPNDDIGGLIDAGSIKIVNGTTGVVLASLEGDNSSDFLGYNGVYDGLPAGGSEGSFVIFSEFDDVDSLVNAGSIKIIDKVLNSEIFNIEGTQEGLRLGSGNPFVLSNGNLVVYSANANFGSLIGAGQATLYSGLNGSVITTIHGDQDNDNLGSDGVLPLANGNFVISSNQDDVNGIINSGSVMLINGLNGEVIKKFRGKKNEDRISIGGTVTFTNSDFAFISDLEDVGSIESAGTVRFVNGSSGEQFFSDQGQSSFDFQNAYITELSVDEYLFSTPGYDLDSKLNSGRVLIYKK